MKKLANLSMFESLMGASNSPAGINSCFNAGGTKLTLTLLAALLPGLIAGCHHNPTMEEQVMEELKYCETVEDVEDLRTRVVRNQDDFSPDFLREFDRADLQKLMKSRADARTAAEQDLAGADE